jgi:hypothetical protein
MNSAGVEYALVGLKARPLSQWLVNGLAEAGLPAICVETRHMKAVLTEEGSAVLDVLRVRLSRAAKRRQAYATADAGRLAKQNWYVYST